MPSPEVSPFNIRAHHLVQDKRTFSDSVFALNQPAIRPAIEAIIADRIAKGTDSILHNRSQIFEGDIPIFDSEEDFERYRRDVLGDNPEERVPEYNKQVLEYFLSFARLKDRDPVHLISGRDGICATCVIGQHCDDPEKINRERVDMDDFVKVAVGIGKKEGKDFSVIKDNDRTLRIETTKRTILAVVSELVFKSMNWSGD